MTSITSTGRVLRAFAPARRGVTVMTTVMVTTLAMLIAPIAPWVTVPAVGVSGAAASTLVIGDDDRDAYVGTGGLVLPRGSAAEPVRRSVAECPGCRWRLRPACDDGSGGCGSVARGCPGGARHLRTWHSRDGGRTWTDLGLACYPPSGPVTVAAVGEALTAEVVREVPPSTISAMPARGAVPHLPVVFAANQPARLRLSMEVLGRMIEVNPAARWHWSFGDGGTLVTDLPGGRFPDRSVAHAYRSAGRYDVVLETTWAATYVVDGLGPFPVAPIRQRATAVVEVRPALGVLVP